MGQRMLLSCENCGCKKTMSVGVGLMTNNPDIIASCLDKDDAEQWKRLYDNQKVDFFQAEQKVFYCNNCKDLQCLLSVDAKLTDGSKITLGDKCEKCHNILPEIKLQDQIECPICKKGKLTWKQVGLWD